MAEIGFDDLLGLGLAPKTSYLYARVLARVLPLLAERGADLSTCRAPDVAVVAESFQNSYSQRQLLRSAMRAGWELVGRDDPPLRALRVPPRPRLRCKALDADPARRLEAAAWAGRYTEPGLAVLFELYSGLRRSETARVRWEDIVDDEHGVPSWLRIVGKGSVEAEIPIHHVLAAALGEVRRRKDPA